MPTSCGFSEGKQKYVDDEDDVCSSASSNVIEWKTRHVPTAEQLHVKKLTE